MKKLKWTLKLILMCFMMMMASTGMVAPPNLMRREKYQDKEITTEYVEQFTQEKPTEIADFNELKQ